MCSTGPSCLRLVAYLVFLASCNGGSNPAGQPDGDVDATADLSVPPDATDGARDMATGDAPREAAAADAPRETAADGGADAGCPASGHVTYTLARAASPTADEQAAYARITAAMDTAVANYNCYTSITKVLNVSYVPTVATADGNVNGSIRFGSTASMNHITAMHEIAHTVGIGGTQFQGLLQGNVFAGANATAQLRAIPDRPQDVVNADRTHFWPYGLNYTTEVKSHSDLVNHCLMVVAIRKDMGM